MFVTVYNHYSLSPCAGALSLSHNFHSLVAKRTKGLSNHGSGGVLPYTRTHHHSDTKAVQLNGKEGKGREKLRRSFTRLLITNGLARIGL